MNSAPAPLFLTLFAIGFAAFWTLIATILGAACNWFALQNEYPDRDEPALATLRHLSGVMGVGVALNGILKLDACASGLRVGIWRIFGPFQRAFFVPWNDISVERKVRLFRRVAELQFGGRPVGRLSIETYAADRLARAAGAAWPEPGPIKLETKRQALVAVASEWAILTLIAGTFFLLAPRLAGGQGVGPPAAVAILFPAIVFGVVSVVRYLNRVGG